MKRWKKGLASLLVLAMLLSALPLNVLAAEGEAPEEVLLTENQGEPGEVPPAENQEKPEEAPPAENQEKPEEAPPAENQEKPEEAPPAENQEKPEEAPPAENQEKPEEAPPAENQEKQEEAPPAENQEKPEEAPPAENQEKPEEVPPMENQEEPEETPLAEEISYQVFGTGEEPVTVTEAGKDGAAFEEDGGFTIPLAFGTAFPCAVNFVVGEQKITCVFGNEAAVNEVGGRVFRVRLLEEEPAATEEQLYVAVSGRQVPLIPMDGPATFSMMPLKEQYYNLDLRNYFLDELKAVDISDILQNLTKRYGEEEPTTDPGQVAAWFKYGYYDEDDGYIDSDDGDYQLVGADKKIDLSQGDSRIWLELIVGKADPLDRNNIRYIIYVQTFYPSELFEFVGVGDISIKDSYYAGVINVDEGVKEKNIFRIEISSNIWDGKSSFPIKIVQKENEWNALNGISWKAYEGYHETPDQAKAAKDITDELKTSYERDFSYKPDISAQSPAATIVLERTADGVCMVMPFVIYTRIIDYTDHISMRYSLYSSPNSSQRVADHALTETDENGVSTQVYEMIDAEWPANGTYYVDVSYIHDDESVNISDIRTYVEKTAVGYFAAAEEVTGDDITEQLFGDGYPADYSGGVVFTVVGKDGQLHHLGVKTIAPLPPAPVPLSADTYFRMQGAHQNGSPVKAYIMPHNADSYYYNGFQTVLLLDGSGNAVAGDICPTFWRGNRVEVFAGLDMDGQTSGAQKQISSESKIALRSGDAVPYSAAAENGRNLKNYWVTFVTKQDGKALFINGINDESRKDPVTGYPVREVFLTEDYSYHHDIFFANTGSEELTNLSIKLLDAKNVELDDYWKIGDVTTLAPFTTTETTTSHGELANVSKIRMVPITKDGKIQAGIVSGILEISADGIETVRIKLTGTAGAPKITTDVIGDGVKYVHYSQLIQTNNMYDSDEITFTYTGKLPGGMRLKANGELYGVPTGTGTFTFTAIATNSKGQSDSKEFTFKILQNTDTNVESGNTGAQGYPLLDRVPNLSGSITAQVFRSQGEYGQFMNFYLDGRKLAEGTDYVSEEGSTKITIRSQTFKNAGNGSHTISAEFRSDGTDQGTMRRTAQNFTISNSGGSTGDKPGGSTGSKPGSGSSGGSGSGPNTAKDPVKKPTAPTTTPPSVPTAPKTAADIFRDISTSHWFFPDVDWAYQNKLMMGVSQEEYHPYAQINQASVTVVLSRLAQVDLSKWSDVPSGIEPGMWYTSAVCWAKEAGLLSEDSFQAQLPITRGQMAVILLKYLQYLGVDYTLPAAPVAFTDAALMTQEENDAFQVLYQFGIFKGVGNYTMDVSGFTTRGQFAALLHRLSVFVEARKASA